MIENLFSGKKSFERENVFLSSSVDEKCSARFIGETFMKSELFK